MATPLSDHDQDVLREAARDTWDIIGDDAFTACDATILSREDVMELVSDANRIESFHPTLPVTVRHFLATATAEEVYAVLRPAFAHAWYGR